jgi:hypothetical protein
MPRLSFWPFGRRGPSRTADDVERDSLRADLEAFRRVNAILRRDLELEQFVDGLPAKDDVERSPCGGKRGATGGDMSDDAERYQLQLDELELEHSELAERLAWDELDRKRAEVDRRRVELDRQRRQLQLEIIQELFDTGSPEFALAVVRQLWPAVTDFRDAKSICRWRLVSIARLASGFSGASVAELAPSA